MRQAPYHRIVDGTLQLRHDGSIIAADAGFCHLIGMSAQDLHERHWISLFHPFDLQEIEQATSLFELQGEANLTVRCVRSDGTMSPVYLHLCRNDKMGADDTDYFCLVLNLGQRIDYTTEKMQYQRLFEISKDLLCVANTTGYFVQVNPAFSRLLGYSREELLQTSYLEFIHPDDIDATLTELRKLRSGIDTLSFENRYRSKDGSWIWLSWSTPASNGDGLLYAVGKDITDYKNLEARLLGLAKYDALSGLPNRHFLEEELTRALARIRRTRQILVGYLIQLNGLERIRALYSQDAHDNLVREFSMRLRQTLRASDVATRIEDNLFFILAEQDSSTKTATLPKRIAEAIETPLDLGNGNLRLEASVGIAVLDGSSPCDTAGFLQTAQDDMARRLQRQAEPGRATMAAEQPVQST